MHVYQYDKIADGVFVKTQIQKLKRLQAATAMLNHHKEPFKAVPLTVVNRILIKEATTAFRYLCPVADIENKDIKYFLTNRPVYITDAPAA